MLYKKAEHWKKKNKIFKMEGKMMYCGHCGALIYYHQLKCSNCEAVLFWNSSPSPFEKIDGGKKELPKNLETSVGSNPAISVTPIETFIPIGDEAEGTDGMLVAEKGEDESQKSKLLLERLIKDGQSQEAGERQALFGSYQSKVNPSMGVDQVHGIFLGTTEDFGGGSKMSVKKEIKAVTPHEAAQILEQEESEREESMSDDKKGSLEEETTEQDPMDCLDDGDEVFPVDEATDPTQKAVTTEEDESFFSDEDDEEGSDAQQKGESIDQTASVDVTLSKRSSVARRIVFGFFCNCYLLMVGFALIPPQKTFFDRSFFFFLLIPLFLALRAVIFTKKGKEIVELAGEAAKGHGWQDEKRWLKAIIVFLVVVFGCFIAFLGENFKAFSFLKRFSTPFESWISLAIMVGVGFILYVSLLMIWKWKFDRFMEHAASHQKAIGGAIACFIGGMLWQLLLLADKTLTEGDFTKYYTQHSSGMVIYLSYLTIGAIILLAISHLFVMEERKASLQEQRTKKGAKSRLEKITDGDRRASSPGRAGKIGSGSHSPTTSSWKWHPFFSGLKSLLMMIFKLIIILLAGVGGGATFAMFNSGALKLEKVFPPKLVLLPQKNVGSADGEASQKQVVKLLKDQEFVVLKKSELEALKISLRITTNFILGIKTEGSERRVGGIRWELNAIKARIKELEKGKKVGVLTREMPPVRKAVEKRDVPPPSRPRPREKDPYGDW